MSTTLSAAVGALIGTGSASAAWAALVSMIAGVLGLFPG